MTITSGTIEDVFAAFKQAARYGKPCPANQTVAKQIGKAEVSVRVAVRILVDEKRIIVERAGGDRRMKIGGYQTTWSAPRPSGGVAHRLPAHEIRYDCREYEEALRASGGRFENADTRGERLNAGPKLPPLNHSPIGCSAATAAGL